MAFDPIVPRKGRPPAGGDGWSVSIGVGGIQLWMPRENIFGKHVRVSLGRDDDAGWLLVEPSTEEARGSRVVNASRGMRGFIRLSPNDIPGAPERMDMTPTEHDSHGSCVMVRIPW